MNIQLEGAVRNTLTKNTCNWHPSAQSCWVYHVHHDTCYMSGEKRHRYQICQSTAHETDRDLTSRQRVNHTCRLTKSESTRTHDNTDNFWSELIYRCVCQLDWWRRDTSGSPVSWLVWMRIFPSRMSLQTAIKAVSMVSPARRMDTPVIYQMNKQGAQV